MARAIRIGVTPPGIGVTPPPQAKLINRWSGRTVASPAILVAFVLLLTVYLIWRDQIMEAVGLQAAEVAAKTIQDEQLVSGAG